jgi:ABC-type transport system involved in cytochrome bd biosynthesis fused ATPase/permease subunit
MRHLLPVDVSSIPALSMLLVAFQFATSQFRTIVETDITNNMFIYAIAAIVVILIEAIVNDNMTRVSMNTKSKYLHTQYSRYTSLDYISRNKGTIQEFQSLLNRAGIAVAMRYSWGFSMWVDMAAAICAASCTMYTHGQYAIITTFLVLDFTWRYFVTTKINAKSKQVRDNERRDRAVLNARQTVLLRRFHQYDATVEDVVDIAFRLDMVKYTAYSFYNVVTSLKKIPNYIIFMIVPFAVESSLYMSLYIVFKNLDSTLRSLTSYTDQQKTFQNDIQMVEDFFIGKTFVEKPPQLKIPKEQTFVGDFFGKPVDFTVKCGERIRIAGASGSGKTSFVNAIQGFAVRGVSLALHAHCVQQNMMSYIDDITHMQQDAHKSITVAKMSIRELFYDGSADYLIKRCLDLVCLDPTTWRVLESNEGYDYKIKSEVEISGGQKTRLSIAIALYKHFQTGASWLIMDEPDAMDPPLATKVLSNIFESPLLRDTTIMVITHLCLCSDKLKFTRTYNVSA